MTRSLIGTVLALYVGVSAVVTGAARPAAASTDVSQSVVTGAEVVQFAERYLGYPYTTVGNSPSTGFSCIGFVSYVYQSLGINLPDDLGGAMGFSPTISFSSLQPGDVLYFQNTVWPGLSHTAIYIGGGRMVHAEWYNRGVVISSFTNDPVDGNYWSQHFLGANRPWATVVSRPAPPAPPASRPIAERPVRRVIRPLPAGPRATVRVEALNVRAAPSLNGRIVTAVSQGTRMAVLGQFNGWYHIALRGGIEGWTVGAGIGRASRIGTAAGVRVSTARTARRIGYGRARLKTIGSVTVGVSGLRVHAAPSLAGRVISTVNLNQRLRLIGSWGQWTHVQLPGGSAGWVSSGYIGTSASRRTAGAVHAGRAAVTRAGTVVNIRVRPSLTSPIAGLLTPGRSYQTLGSANGWTHVRVSTGVTGWVSSAVVQSRGAASASAVRGKAGSGASGTGSTLSATVRVHSRPGVGSRAVAVAYMGTSVRVIGTGGTWSEVRLPSGVTGYVLRAYLQ